MDCLLFDRFFYLSNCLSLFFNFNYPRVDWNRWFMCFVFLFLLFDNRRLNFLIFFVFSYLLYFWFVFFFFCDCYWLRLSLSLHILLLIRPLYDLSPLSFQRRLRNILFGLFYYLFLSLNWSNRFWCWGNLALIDQRSFGSLLCWLFYKDCEGGRSFFSFCSSEWLFLFDWRLMYFWSRLWLRFYNRNSLWLIGFLQPDKWKFFSIQRIDLFDFFTIKLTFGEIDVIYSQLLMYLLVYVLVFYLRFCLIFFRLVRKILLFFIQFLMMRMVLVSFFRNLFISKLVGLFIMLIDSIVKILSVWEVLDFLWIFFLSLLLCRYFLILAFLVVFINQFASLFFVYFTFLRLLFFSCSFMLFFMFRTCLF